MTQTKLTGSRWQRIQPAMQLTIRVGAAIAGTAGVVWLLLALAGVFQPKVPEAESEPQLSAAAGLPQAEVQLLTRPRYETAVGTIKPIHEAAVASKLMARIVETNVTAGQAVKAGDILFRLDDEDLQARLKQAEAAEAAALARKQQADSDFDRARKLIATKAISQSEYERAEATVRTRTSELEQARHTVAEAKVVLDYATVRSPLTGIVVDKQVETGDMVAPGRVLLTLYDPTRMQMVASVRESLAQQLKVGQQLPARLESLGYDCEATVSEIVPEAAGASRSFAVKVTGPCPPGIYSGMFGRLLLPLDDEQVIVVPAAAVRQIGQLCLVDVVDQGVVRRRHVQLGRRFDGEVEVLSGLQPGEKVVLSRTDSSG